MASQRSARASPHASSGMDSMAASAGAVSPAASSNAARAQAASAPVSRPIASSAAAPWPSAMADSARSRTACNSGGPGSAGAPHTAARIRSATLGFIVRPP